MKKESKLEKEISEKEDARVMEKIKKLSDKRKNDYLEGYADAIIYLSENYNFKLKKVKRRFYSIEDGEFFELKC